MLMHLPVQDEAMSRTGVFVIRKDDGDWEPLTVRFKDQLYLLECKGVGSGLEGYTQFHHRNQAGSAKHHVRVTGGMTIDGVENEMKHLIQFQTYFNFNVSGILPFACIGFELESSIQEPIKLGLLLRLSPSNVRFSYESFGDFSNKLSINDVLPKIANINKQFYQSGFRHENMSSNNLCFLYPDSYVPTDFEELTSIYSVPASLDVQPTDHPMYLKIYPFKYSHNECYPNLLQSSYMDDQLTNSEINTNFQLSHNIIILTM